MVNAVTKKRVTISFSNFKLEYLHMGVTREMICCSGSLHNTLRVEKYL